MHKNNQKQGVISPQKTIQALGISEESSGTFSDRWSKGGTTTPIHSPIDGSLLASVRFSSPTDYEEVIGQSLSCFSSLKLLPAPKRGEIIREFANAVREKKQALAELISWEMGKILPEALGEVQEVIDIADFAVGLSRQLYGLSMHSERPSHRMYEQWHPLGPCAVITAFNFPMAVWAWNSCLAVVCGDPVIWKPSELTPLSAIALNSIAARIASAHNLPSLFTLLTGTGSEVGVKLSEDSRVPLVSATGSTSMGRDVGTRVAKRFGRSLLELGGNNAVIVLDDADLDLSTRAIVFGAAGTAGQRCTTIRRLFVQKNVAKDLSERIARAYQQLKIGHPLEPGTLIGPLIHERAVRAFSEAILLAKDGGAEVLAGGTALSQMPSANYVTPTLLKVPKTLEVMKQETFAPILYLQEIDSLEQGIELNNAVSQGLSSAIFTRSLRSAEHFLAATGSDCGIANVNIGTSGAEIGGAFGGEKETGGGREAGSDSWKAYMRRQTTTINWGDSLPLAQGVKFE